MGLEEAAAVRALWRRQRELERILHDRLEIEPVKAEALRELEEITEYLRQSPWLSRHGAERCVRAVTAAMKRFYSHLAGGVDVEGKPDEVLQAFAMHLRKHLLILSGRGGAHTRKQAFSGFAGCFIYRSPRGVVWEVQSLEPAESKVSRLESKVPTLEYSGPRPAAVGYLSRFLCAGFALALLATGCASTRPLKGGKAVTMHKPAGVIEQSLVQGENPSQASKQTQESVKVRTYTLPVGSRVEQSLNADCGLRSAEGRKAEGVNANAQPSTSFAASRQPSTLNAQPSTSFVLSAPMPVVEREETHAA